MARPALSRPVIQERSRRTRDRLLDAAEAVLARAGADGTTVPAIADEAGVAVGSVYRRFADKDALLRGVYERFFTEAAETNRAGLAPEVWAGMDAGAVVAALVEGMVEGYRLKRRLLRALIQYGDTHPDAEFRRRATALRAETFRMIGDLLVARAAQLRHPRPRDAVAFALGVVRHTLQGYVLQGERKLDDARLVEELTRMIGGYLGLAPRQR